MRRIGISLKKSDKLLLIGGGGHCHSVIDSVISSDCCDELGVVAKDQGNYDELLGDALVAPYLVGTDAVLPKLFEDGWKTCFITLGSVGKTGGRRALYKRLIDGGFELTTIIDPSAIVSDSAAIGDGVYIGKRAVVNAGSRIGTCSIINTGAIVEHDCRIGAFAHVSPGSTLCGQVTIGDDSHVGAGSVVRQQITIGPNSLIGAGSIVVSDIPAMVTAFGNPCKVVR